MRWTMAVMMLATAPAVAVAQGGAAPTAALPAPTLPASARRLAVERWNGANEFRAVDRAEISDGSEIRGNVSVLRGPLMLGGHVTGSVLVINGDVIMRPTARIEGDLIVIGGDVEGRSSARVDGATQIYRQSLAYREEGDRLVALGEDGKSSDDTWWRRLERRREGNWSQALRVVQAGAYNRVEGLPIELGPVIQRLTPWGSVRLDAAAIVRTGSTWATDRADVGHTLRAEVRTGRERGIGVGAHVFNQVDPVESWQLSDLETALAAFLARRDYRDYFQRHGATGEVTLYGARSLSLSTSFGEERWSSRVLRNPFTLFNPAREWRPNPATDEGLFHVGDVSLQFDTRTDETDPWAGWFLNADLEHGSGHVTLPAPVSASGGYTANQRAEYTRGFFDFRRYNRLGPSAQLNVRLVAAGWLGGDPLPLERRVSVDGPGSLPGFGFRSERTGADLGNCNAGARVMGTPAECDRMMLAQAEYRGNLKIGFGGGWEDWPHRYRSARGDVSWVLFADAGRGWRVGTPDATNLVLSRGELPDLSTFRTDMGVGLDIAGIGIYAAKALSSPSEPVNFFVRLRHRF